jgi:hypothetical protein
VQVLVAVTDPIAQFELVDTLVAWQHDVRVAAVACDVRNCLSRGPQPRVVIVDAGMLPAVAGAPRLPRTRLLLLDEAAGEATADGIGASNLPVEVLVRPYRDSLRRIWPLLVGDRAGGSAGRRVAGPALRAACRHPSGGAPVRGYLPQGRACSPTSQR